jgi:peptidoglycan/LPS O-acetylase OafA/YrhL
VTLLAEPSETKVSEQRSPSGWASAHARTRWLDGLRGCAALFVVLHHMWLSSWPFFPNDHGPWFLGWLLYGHLGVAVFIVVSGYSLTLAPVRSGGALKGGARRFLRRRAWRILPAYWAALTLSALAFALILQPEVGDGTVARSFLIHATLLQDVFGNTPVNGTFWSVAVEWQIYFVFPLILLLAWRWSMVAAVAVTTATVLVAHELAVHGGSAAAKIGHLSPQFLALFAFGVLASWKANGPWAATAPRWARPAVWGVTVAAFAGVVALAQVKGSPWMTQNWFSVDLLFGVAVAGGLYLAANTTSPLRDRTLGSRPLLVLGSFSYSLYLVHAPIVEGMQRWVIGPIADTRGANFVLLLAIALPVVLALAYFFFLVFEKPFLDRRDLASLKTLAPVRWWRARRGHDDDAAVPSWATAPIPSAVDAPRFSVAVPAYNAAGVVAMAIDSVLAQSEPAHEVLVYDDGSTDGTAAVLAQYGDRIRVLSAPNGGVAHARNVMCREATGDVVAFLDADDAWHPRYLETQRRLLAARPEAIASFTYHVDFVGTGAFGAWPQDDPAVAVAAAAPLSALGFLETYNKTPMRFQMSGFCLPVDTLARMGDEPFLEAASGADDGYAHNVLPLLGPVVATPVPMTAYRIIDGSISSNQMRMAARTVSVFDALAPRYAGGAVPRRLARTFAAARASRRRDYGKFLMGAGKMRAARGEFAAALSASRAPSSMVKSMALLALSMMPSGLQPRWPGADRVLEA